MWFAAQTLQGLSGDGFDARPFSILTDEQSRDLGVMASMALLEGGSLLSRRHWQQKQLNNLIGFARQHSAFWRARTVRGFYDEQRLAEVAVLTRQELMEQVRLEGALSDREPALHKMRMSAYSSTGSTGVSVETFSLSHNARFNELRSLAQYFMEGRRLDRNRTFIKPAPGLQIATGQRVSVEILPGWLGSLSGVFSGGHYKIVSSDFDAQSIVSELRKHPVGYLACLNSHMQALVDFLGKDIASLGIEMWLHHSDDLSADLVSFLDGLGIDTRSSYSCSELGPIAVQCQFSRDHFHVVDSNVLVHALDEPCLEDGQQRLLITHLHSYATPLIRYEVGDCARVFDRCACSREGTTLSNIRGRKKNYILARDGVEVFLPLFSKPMHDLLAFKECFFEQFEPGRVVLWVVPVGDVQAFQINDLGRYLKGISRADFEFEVRLVGAIDWSANPKRIPFIRRV